MVLKKTTVAQIAERAGPNRRTFFHHFADKREVVFAGGGEAYEAHRRRDPRPAGIRGPAARRRGRAQGRLRHALRAAPRRRGQARSAKRPRPGCCRTTRWTPSPWQVPQSSAALDPVVVASPAQVTAVTPTVSPSSCH
ncbi:MAG TPA: helix-turn-helix domain-containing protein [Streptosporangiaceae bacterium]|nr:helix-turn-helix domain-containing protein [Streptosporangiaceae bacterium]